MGRPIGKDNDRPEGAPMTNPQPAIINADQAIEEAIAEAFLAGWNAACDSNESDHPHTHELAFEQYAAAIRSLKDQVASPSDGAVEAREIWAQACEDNGHYTYARYLRSGQSPGPPIDENDDGEILFYATLAAITAALTRPDPAAGVTARELFQARVQPWLMACFGEMIAGDREERNHRFLEEALELVQACGCDASEAHQLVDYVYARPIGEPDQEVGGVMVTLAALCLANGLDMHDAAETELARVWAKVDVIRAKRAAKPKRSPLPASERPQPDLRAMLEKCRDRFREYATGHLEKQLAAPDLATAESYAEKYTRNTDMADEIDRALSDGAAG